MKTTMKLRISCSSTDPEGNHIIVVNTPYAQQIPVHRYKQNAKTGEWTIARQPQDLVPRPYGIHAAIDIALLTHPAHFYEMMHNHTTMIEVEQIPECMCEELPFDWENTSLREYNLNLFKRIKEYTNTILDPTEDWWWVGAHVSNLLSMVATPSLSGNILFKFVPPTTEKEMIEEGMVNWGIRLAENNVHQLVVRWGNKHDYRPRISLYRDEEGKWQVSPKCLYKGGDSPLGYVLKKVLSDEFSGEVDGCSCEVPYQGNFKADEEARKANNEYYAQRVSDVLDDIIMVFEDESSVDYVVVANLLNYFYNAMCKLIDADECRPFVKWFKPNSVSYATDTEE